ncbi:ABC transporter substrate-binding protein (plasmid) [Paraburkholderia graminis]|uniref:ABC transporter substrate-binding protein n=1 Tax=Paraburkholderia graminis TaxID=60548 RepID=UPI000DEF4DD7|nr:ABC transporter substrate-binding protein [Paraburkholderia graminis]AXF12613.1 ABC transporter substrate-binding protein [Paraburkholderia graminis]
MKRFFVAAMTLLVLHSSVSMASDAAVIRFGVDASYPPLEFKDPEGKPTGFDIDLGSEICRRLNARCEFVDMSFDGLIPALLSRKFDGVLSSLSVTEQRKKEISFSDKLFSLPSRLVARRTSGITPTEQGLKGKTVGVEQGTIQETFARTYWQPAGAHIQAYQSQDQVYADLTAGRLDASFQDEVQANVAFLTTPRGKDFAFAGPVLRDTRVLGDGATAVGLRKDDVELRDKINRALHDMHADGTFQRIEKKYFDFDVYSD